MLHVMRLIVSQEKPWCVDRHMTRLFARSPMQRLRWGTISGGQPATLDPPEKLSTPAPPMLPPGYITAPIISMSPKLIIARTDFQTPIGQLSILNFPLLHFSSICLSLS